MNALRSWISVVALWSVGVGAGQQLWAQQDGGSTDHALGDSPPSLAARVNELDQQLPILKRLGELAADSAAAAPLRRETGSPRTP